MIKPGLLKTRAAFEYVRLISQLTGDTMSYLKTQYKEECEALSIDITDRESCIGINNSYTIKGCTFLATRAVHTVEWKRMRQDGIPRSIRDTLTTPMCENCQLLCDSQWRQTKTRWIQIAGKLLKKSPSTMAKFYNTELEILQGRIPSTNYHHYTDNVNKIEVALDIALNISWDGEITNIDSSKLKSKGIVTITVYKHVT